MYRYEIHLYSGQRFFTLTDQDNKLKDSNKYIQLLGFINRSKSLSYSFWRLKDLDLSSLKGLSLCLVDTRGLIKILSAKVREVKKVKI